MNRFIIFIFSISLPVFINAQSFLNFYSLHHCSYNAPVNNDKVPISHTTDWTVKTNITDILEAVDLRYEDFDFKIKSAARLNGNPACAVYDDGERYILHTYSLPEKLKAGKGSQEYWAAIGVLAHEIGHHLFDHTLDDNTNRKREEIEADIWSGYSLYKMGASLSEARAAVYEYAAIGETSTHPDLNKRIAAVTSGFNAAEEEDSWDITDWVIDLIWDMLPLNRIFKIVTVCGNALR